MMKKLLLILAVMFLLALPTGFSALSDGLTSYYKQDNNDMNDSLGTYNLTSTTTNTSGIILDGRNFSSQYHTAPTGMITTSTNLSINMWLYPTAFADGKGIIMKRDAAINWDIYINDAAGKVYVRFYDSDRSDAINAIYDALLTANVWQMITIVLNGTAPTDIHVYKNGTLISPTTTGGTALDTLSDNGDAITFGNEAGTYYAGKMDEIGIWKARAITQAEVTELYNNSAGLPYPFSVTGNSINMSTTLPATNESFSVTTINFNTTVNSTTNFNCSLYLNSTLNQTRTGFINGSSKFVDFNVTFPSGTNSYTYYVYCDNGVSTVNSSAKTFYVDDVLPVITNDINGSVFTGSTFTGHINYSDTYLYSYNITWDGLQFDNKTNIGISLYRYNFSANIASNSSGVHTIWTRACDGHTAQQISNWDYAIKGNKISFAGLSITASDATKASLTKTTDRYSPTFEYDGVVTSKKYVIESSYPIEKAVRTNYKGWFVIPALERWIDFEDGTNSKVTYARINDYKWEVYVENPATKVTYNSLGELNCVNQTMTWFYAKPQSSASATIVYQNQPVSYELNVSFNTSWMSNITASLEYNNTNYSVSPTTSSTLYTFDKILSAANITLINENKTFKWFYTIQGISGNVSSNTSSTAQQVYKTVMDNCSVYTTYAFNFTIKNETTGIWLNGTTELSINHYAYGITTNYNTTFTTYDYPNICIWPAWTNFSADFHIDYTSPGFGTFSYFTNNTIVDNVTNLINLYLVDGTTQVIFTVTDQDDTKIEGALIKVMKYDVGTNTYFTTEVLKTDSSGLAIGNIVLNTVWYKFIIEYNGVVVLETSPTKITGTSKTFRINLLTDYFDNYDISDGVAKSLTFNNGTKNFVLTWSDPHGTMHYGCLKVIKMSINGDTLINDTCTESTAATILVNIGSNASVGKNTYIATSYAKFDEMFIWDTLSVSFDNAWAVFGKHGIWMSFFIILTMALIGIWNPIAAIALVLIGFTAVNLLGFYHLGWEYLVTFIILGAIAIWKQGSDK